MKWSTLWFLAVFSLHCGAGSLRMPGSTVSINEDSGLVLPDRPDSGEIPAVQDWVVAVEAGEQLEQSGICMGDQKALRAARFVVAYNELRGLYSADLRTWQRERGVYRRYLDQADEELEYWQERSRRTWMERHGAHLYMGLGVFVGAGLAIGLTYGLNKAAD